MVFAYLTFLAIYLTFFVERHERDIILFIDECYIPISNYLTPKKILAIDFLATILQDLPSPQN